MVVVSCRMTCDSDKKSFFLDFTDVCGSVQDIFSLLEKQKEKIICKKDDDERDIKGRNFGLCHFYNSN